MTRYLLWCLKWGLLARKCRGCDRPEPHSHDLTLLGRIYYAPWRCLES